MNRLRKWIILGGVLVAIPLLTAGSCESQADKAAYNASVAAENFEVNRHIVGINGITDQYLFEVTGYCSVETAESALAHSLEVTCKRGEDPNGKALIEKHFLGISDNTTFVVEQIAPQPIDVWHTRIIFRPETLIPDIDLETSGEN